MSPAPQKTHSTPSGVLYVGDLPVATGDVDLYIYAGTTITIPPPATTPIPTSIPYLSLPFTILPDSRLAFPDTTLAPNAPGQFIPGSQDYLAQSASYGDGTLVLGQKTSTDTYPPQVLETAAGLKGATRTWEQTTGSEFQEKQAVTSTMATSTTSAKETQSAFGGSRWMSESALLPLTKHESTLATQTTSRSSTISKFGPFLGANATEPIGTGTVASTGSGTGVISAPTGVLIIPSSGAGRLESSGAASTLSLALVLFMLTKSWFS